jgi:hypothetical protein
MDIADALVKPMKATQIGTHEYMSCHHLASDFSYSDDSKPIPKHTRERPSQARDAISRFFREAFEQEFYLRKLAKHGVRVVFHHTAGRR